MASYWKSPYKERSQPESYDLETRAALDSFIPLGSRTYCGLSKVKAVWFDWALAITKSTPGPPPRGRIKGILKPSLDPECERTGPDSESAASVASDSVVKKRVRFGENLYNGGSFNHRPRPEQSPHRQAHTRDGRLKPTATKRMTDPLTGNLPSILGTGVVAVASGESTAPRLNSSSSCRHSVDLRCAQCVAPTETSATNMADTPETPLHQPVNNKPGPAPNFTSGCDPAQGSSPTLKQYLVSPREDKTQEPLKRYKPHWTKTFLRAAKKRQGAHTTVRKTPKSFKTFPKTTQDGAYQEPISKKLKSSNISEEFCKLHISGDGKMVRTKLIPRDRSSHKTPRSTAAVTATDGSDVEASETSPRHSASLGRQNSAPSRLRQVSSGPQTEPILDKTSQIISWLNDVRTKSRFRPRHDRSYPLPLQATALRQ